MVPPAWRRRLTTSKQSAAALQERNNYRDDDCSDTESDVSALARIQHSWAPSRLLVFLCDSGVAHFTSLLLFAFCDRSANPTQSNVYDRLLDQNYWTGTYKQRFQDYERRPKTADYKPYELGGSANFWEMRRKRKAQQALDTGTAAHFAANLRGANLYDPRNRMCVDDADLDTAHRGTLRRHADRRRTSALPRSYARGLTQRLHSTESGAKGSVRMDGNWAVLQHDARQKTKTHRQQTRGRRQQLQPQPQKQADKNKKAATGAKQRPDSPTSLSGSPRSCGSPKSAATAGTGSTLPSYARPTTASSGQSRRSRALAPRPRLIIKSASASVLSPKVNISAWSPGANASTLKRTNHRAAHATAAALREAVLNEDDESKAADNEDETPYSRRAMLELLRKAASAPVPRRALTAAARGVLT